MLNTTRDSFPDQDYKSPYARQQPSEYPKNSLEDKPEKLNKVGDERADELEDSCNDPTEEIEESWNQLRAENQQQQQDQKDPEKNHRHSNCLTVVSVVLDQSPDHNGHKGRGTVKKHRM